MIIERNSLERLLPLCKVLSIGALSLFSTTSLYTSQANQLIRYAAANGNNNLVLKAINSGANIEDTGEMDYCPGLTPLMIAAYYGNPHTIKILLEHNANADTVDNHGDTAFIYAIFSAYLNVKNKIRVVLALIKADANINTTNHEGHSALVQAANSGYKNIVPLLLKRGALPPAQRKIDESHPLSDGEKLIKKHLYLYKKHQETTKESLQKFLSRDSQSIVSSFLYGEDKKKKENQRKTKKSFGDDKESPLKRQRRES